MFSNRMTPFILSGLLLFTGCDQFLRSAKTDAQKEKQATLRIDPKGAQCLADVPKQLGGFLDDTASEAQVGQAFDCINTSLDTFVKLTKGQNADIYTDEELRHFLNRYLLKKNQVTTSFMTEIMKIKVLVSGGTLQVVSRDELTHIASFMTLIKAEALKVRGSIAFFLYKADPAQLPTEEHEKQIMQQMKSSMQTLVAATNITQATYEFRDFHQFLDELDQFLADPAPSSNGSTESQDPDQAVRAVDSPTSSPQTQTQAPPKVAAKLRVQDFQAWIPLVETLRDLFWGPTYRPNNAREWKTSIDWAMDGYFLSLQYNYHLRGKSFDLPATWSSLMGVMDHLLKLVENSPVFLANGILETAAIDRTLDELWKHPDLLNLKLDVGLVKNTFKMLILRFFMQNHAVDASPQQLVKGLERSHVSYLRAEFNILRLTEDSIVDQFQDRDVHAGTTPAEIEQALGSRDWAGQFKNWREADHDELIQSVQDWKDLVTIHRAGQPNRPVQWAENRRVFMSYDYQHSKTSFFGLSLQNCLRTAVRFVLRGYGTGQSRSVFDWTLPQDGLVNLEKDFEPIGLATGLLDSRSVNPAQRTFKEANLLTYHGNGDTVLNNQELFEELNMMMSGGAFMATDLVNEAAAAGLATGQKDPQNHSMLDSVRFKTYFLANYPRLLADLPEMEKDLEAMDETRRSNFYDSLMNISVYKVKPTDPPGPSIEYAEIRNAMVVLHYVEGLVLMYDSNQDNKLTAEEISAAAPRFRSFIANLSPLGNVLVDDIFLCLIYQGKKPTAGDLTRFLFAKRFGLGQIQREQLIMVLSVLKADAAAKP